ncbi:hypothetical protein BJX62DRAFT_240125 [Aspergillus germanicus]
MSCTRSQDPGKKGPWELQLRGAPGGGGNLEVLTTVGMLGNAANLSAILEWYTSFWDQGDDGVDLWADEIILGINNAMKTLCEAFDNVETAHHKAFGLTGNKKDQAPKKAKYESFCAARRRELAHILPPARGTPAED